MTNSRPRWRSIPFIALFAGLGAALPALEPAAELPPPPQEGHRALRDNPQGPPPDPQPAKAFTGYPDAPEFSVVSRRDVLSHYPCADCHAQVPANPCTHHTPAFRTTVTDDSGVLTATTRKIAIGLSARTVNA